MFLGPENHPESFLQNNYTSISSILPSKSLINEKSIKKSIKWTRLQTRYLDHRSTDFDRLCGKIILTTFQRGVFFLFVITIFIR